MYTRARARLGYLLSARSADRYQAVIRLLRRASRVGQRKDEYVSKTSLLPRAPLAFREDDTIPRVRSIVYLFNSLKMFRGTIERRKPVACVNGLVRPVKPAVFNYLRLVSVRRLIASEGNARARVRLPVCLFVFM